ncbi:MAG: DNA recombination protein RmuC [Nocardioidaceae bacterium]
MVNLMDSTTIVIALLTALAALVVGVLIGQQLANRKRGELSDELRALSAQAVTDSSQQVLALADSRVRATEQVVAPVRDSLNQLNDRLRSLESQGASWQAQLKQQVESVQLSGVELRQQTQALADALRRPQVRGHWGEMQLRRSLELAGLTSRCTFEEQVSRHTDDGFLRPDVVINLAGGKSVVVDSKVSLDAFLTATQSVDPVERDAGLGRHARQVRQHVDALAAKSYWRQFSPTPEFVVMFLPAEAIFAQAAESDPGLIDYAAGKQVMIATPMTLIAMLKTVAFAWTQEALAENAREVHQLGCELYDRLATVGGHLDKLGRSMSAAVTSYNKTVASVESRVLVSARKMRDLQVTDAPLPAPSSITEAARPLTAPELLVSSIEEPTAIEGPPGREQWARRAVGE